MTFQKYFCNFRLMIKNVMQNRHIIILHTILLFLTTTLPSIVINSGIHERYTDGSPDSFGYLYKDIFELLSFTSPWQIFITVGVAIITSFCCYSYLNSTSSLVFHNSMPYKRSNLYFTRFISGIVQLAIPVIIIFAVNSAMYFGYDVSKYTDVTYHSFISNTLLCLFMYILTFSVGAFTANISSNIFAQGISLLFVYLVYVLSVAIIGGNFDVWFETYRLTPNLNILYIFPPWIIAEGTLTAGLLVYYILYFITFTALGCIASVKRATESTNKFFAFGFINTFLKYYISVFASLGFGLIFAEISNNNVFLSLTGYILFGFLAFAILQAIFEKNIRAMFTNLKGFTVFAVILIAVMFIPTSGILDLDNRLPTSASYVKVEQISQFSGLTLKDPKNIDAALKLAKAAKDSSLKYIETGGPSSRSTSYVTMNFGNKLIARRFRYTLDSDIREFTATVYDSKECKEYITNIIENSTMGYIEKNNLSSMNNIGDYKLSKAREELKKLLAQDVNKSDYNDIKSSYLYAYVQVEGKNENGNFHQTIPVYSCYEDTVELIKNTFLIPPQISSLTLKIEGKDVNINITSQEDINNIYERTTHIYYNAELYNEGSEYAVHFNERYVGYIFLTDSEIEALKANN